MRKEEAELKLKKYHARLFAKRKDKNLKAVNDSEFDAFEILRILSKGNSGMNSLKMM
jgi:hypothetical protein